MQERVMRASRFADYIQMDWAPIFAVIAPQNHLSDQQTKAFLLQYIEALHPIYQIAYADEARYLRFFPDHFFTFMHNYEAIVDMVKYIDERDSRPELLVEVTQIWRKARLALAGRRLNKPALERLIPPQTIQPLPTTELDRDLDVLDFEDEVALQPDELSEITRPMTRVRVEAGQSRASLRFLLAITALSLSASVMTADRYPEHQKASVGHAPAQMAVSEVELHGSTQVGASWSNQP